MKRSYVLCSVGILTIILASVFLASAAKAPDSPDAVKIKPDIVVRDVSIARSGVTPMGHNVQISVTVANLVESTSTGPFKVKVEWTEDPTTGFTLLGTGGVTNLANNPASSVALQSKTLSFDQLVPAGKSYKYRVTADYMNQVEERDESNNVYSAGYNAI